MGLVGFSSFRASFIHLLIVDFEYPVLFFISENDKPDALNLIISLPCGVIISGNADEIVCCEHPNISCISFLE